MCVKLQLCVVALYMQNYIPIGSVNFIFVLNDYIKLQFLLDKNISYTQFIKCSNNNTAILIIKVIKMLNIYLVF